MALDSSIISRLQGSNPLAALQQGMQVGGMFADLRNRPEQQARAEEERQLKLQGLQQQLASGQAQQKAAQITNAQNAENFRITQAATAYQKVQSDIDSGNYQVARGKLVNEKKLLNDSGVTNTPDIDAAIGALDSKDPMQILGIKTIGDKVMLAAQQRGLFKDPSSGVPAEEQAFESLIKNFTPEQQAEARLVKSGLKGRATGSAAQTIADAGTAEQVAESQAIIRQREKFGEMTGASRAKTIDSSFDKLNKINSGIDTIDRAVLALESGAGTGAIERFLPSFKAASVELDNIRNQLALDVIGGVTLGAISAAELDLAKQVALPTGLDGPQLIQHLRERKSAQQKVAAYFREQIDFLDQGGTVAGFLRSKERSASTGGNEQAPTQPAQQQGSFTSKSGISFTVK